MKASIGLSCHNTFPTTGTVDCTRSHTLASAEAARNLFLTVTVASDAPSPLQELEMKELKRRLVDCMKKLPAAWRAVLALRDGETVPYEEIATSLGVALGTVRSRLARARLSLRRCVEGEAS